MRLTMLFSLVLFLALGAVSASAQAPDALQVTVPFAFTVHNVSMPAGDYRITRAANTGLLAIQNVDTCQTLFFLGSQTGRSLAAEHSTVAFRSASAGYMLADIYWAGYAAGVQLQTLEEPVLTASIR